MALGRSLVFILFLSLQVPGYAASEASPRERFTLKRAPVGTLPNEECVGAGLVSIEFSGIKGYRNFVNYCALPVAALAPDVRGLIERARELGKRVADVLGQSPEATYRSGIRISIRLDPEGSIKSDATSQGITLMTSNPEWTLADFSASLYVHELVHILAFNPGPTAEMLAGLEEHPFLVEALPDLIATEVTRSSKLKLAERGLPACLETRRDFTTIHSLSKPFGFYYALADSDQTADCCATLDFFSDQISDFAKYFCHAAMSRQPELLTQSQVYREENRLTGTSFEAAELKKPFDPASCRLKSETGLVVFSNCDSHQFAYPLVSFFRRLEARTGRSHITAFLQKMRERASMTNRYECQFAAAVTKPELGGTKSLIGLRSLLDVFTEYRKSLSRTGRRAFDRTWSEHAFTKLALLDQMVLKESLATLAQTAVKLENKHYRDAYHCENLFDFDARDCQVSCTPLR